ncbi:SDR family oxidoreductase [Nocardia fusca]|uniref:SDR family oxidoreductase n=1 Tax=Nocardia fusca TaxID=941183 RepID=UPI0037BBCB3F
MSGRTGMPDPPGPGAKEWNMDLGIKGRVALVTGGSRGIGRATAIELARAGCDVAVVARNKPAIDETVGELRGLGVCGVGISADCVTEDGVREAVARTRVELGDPSIVVFNVDSGPRGGYGQVSDDDMLAGFRHNVLALKWLVDETSAAMQQAGWGRYLSIATMALRQPHRALSRLVADTTRMGTAGLNKNLANHLGPSGITCNILGTGSIETEAFQATFTQKAGELGISYEEMVERKVADIPVGRLGKPEDMAAAAAFLCSDRAGFITGQLLLIDGGRVESVF